jgi:hypothetical protein
MKLLSVLICVLCCGIGYSEAQTKEDVKVRVRTPEVPIVVMKSMVRDFPQFKFDLDQIASNQKKGEPRVLYNNQLDPEVPPTHYSVRVRGENFKGTSTYDKDGQLLFAREVKKNTTLPKATRNQLYAQYKDWSILRNREIVNLNGKKPQHYTIIMAKGNERKKVLIDNQGIILKDKNRFRI